MNLHNISVGTKAVILGSGDIGLIMARRLTLEGAHVEAVCELMPYSNGLPRNIQQCLNDFKIPLYLATSVIEVHGRDRITGVTIARFDAHRQPVADTQRFIACDTLLLSVGLLPENELARQTSITIDDRTSGAIVDECYMTSVPGIFACGNALHVHDLVDFVSIEAERAGTEAARWTREKGSRATRITVTPAAGVRYVLPQRFCQTRDITLSLRPLAPARSQRLIVRDGEMIISEKSLAHVHPAEMIQHTIPVNECSHVSGLEVEIRDV
jgi:pyruvate/2-oxoglutarate dehydrogenase complex dihydrolipoamide dehydrogenase (E3) component